MLSIKDKNADLVDGYLYRGSRNWLFHKEVTQKQSIRFSISPHAQVPLMLSMMPHCYSDQRICVFNIIQFMCLQTAFFICSHPSLNHHQMYTFLTSTDCRAILLLNIPRSCIFWIPNPSSSCYCFNFKNFISMSS